VDDKNYVVVTVSGRDRPGITAAFTKILINHNIEVIDIDQATIQDHLGLSFLLDLSGTDRSKDNVLKDLLFQASRLEMNLNFQLLSENELRDKPEKNLFVLTFFGGTKTLGEISGILGEEHANIEKITNLGRDTARCFELVINVSGAENLARLKGRVIAKSHDLGIDLAMQKMEAYRKNKRLVFFDMDRTLIDMEIIDEMARAAGVFDEVSRVTEKAMRGEIDFDGSLRQRVALMKGLHEDHLGELRDGLRLSEGAEELIATLKRLGYKLGVVSGGFHFFADFLKEKLDLDFAFANGIEIKDSRLTGKVIGEIVDDSRKARIVNQVAREMGVLLDQTVAIGDGANDLLMLGQAGLGIAYNAGKELKRTAGTSLGHTRLKNVLYILGISEEDVGTPAKPSGRRHP
jgi:phosphoserine phosphatase